MDTFASEAHPFNQAGLSPEADKCIFDGGEVGSTGRQ